MERELLGKESGQANITIGLDFELQLLQGAFEEWGSEKHLLSAEFEKYASGKSKDEIGETETGPEGGPCRRGDKNLQGNEVAFV